MVCGSVVAESSKEVEEKSGVVGVGSGVCVCEKSCVCENGVVGVVDELSEEMEEEK